MQKGLKEQFAERWERYFPSAALPICFFYTDDEKLGEPVEPHAGMHCMIRELARVRAGESLSFSGAAIGCAGGRFFLGFSQRLRPDFNYFLSCGIPGRLEGERYKASPELVAEQFKNDPGVPAPARYIVFKRWDALAEGDEPDVVVFFCPPDVMSGLFTLANFDESDAQAVIAPMGSGCSSIVHHPYRELKSSRPRAVLGMFDVSARPWVPPGELTLAIPWPKFLRMVSEMDESFLGTESWSKVKMRIFQAREQ
ncbi:MAG: DUF169 domain-containing protein [Spirochaetia bacterium]